MDYGISINELPLEILLEIFAFFSIPEIARIPMTCAHWRDLMQQDHFWASLARKTYGQYVGETPKKCELEELSERCGQELTFIHWLQYRSLFGLTMNMAVHVGVFMPDDAFDYKVTLEPGLNMGQYKHDSWRNFDYGDSDGLRTTSWNATFFVVVNTETGENFREEIPLISITDLNHRGQIRRRGKVYKYKLKLTRMMHKFLEVLCTFHAFSYYYQNPAAMQILNGQLRYRYGDLRSPFIQVNTDQNNQELYPPISIVRAPFEMSRFKPIFREENPFILAPTCAYADVANVSSYGRNTAYLMYEDLTVHEFVPIIAKNFNEIIKSQMQLYLAEIVCGFEVLHSKGLFLRHCTPVIKENGHLQFIYARPDIRLYSYFGLPPESKFGKLSAGLARFRADCYALGVFMLEVSCGTVLRKDVSKVIEPVVPPGLPLDLHGLLLTLADPFSEARPKTIDAIKTSPYFKGIDWHKMRRQDWSPKFLPNLDFNEDEEVAQDSRNSSTVCN